MSGLWERLAYLPDRDELPVEICESCGVVL